MQSFLRNTKQLVVILLALVAALLVTLGVLQIRVWLQPHAASGTTGGQSLTDQQKLNILASLSASSSASAAEKSKVLHSLSVPAKTGPTDEEKLKILQSLQAKP
jgi:hypothetical protein